MWMLIKLFKMYMKKRPTPAERTWHLISNNTLALAHTYLHAASMSSGVQHTPVCEDWVFWAITVSSHSRDFH